AEGDERLQWPLGSRRWWQALPFDTRRRCWLHLATMTNATMSQRKPFSTKGELTMAINELQVSNGPDKADLLRAVTNPAKHLHVTFDTPVDPMEAHLDKIEEIGADGVTFGLRGHI